MKKYIFRFLAALTALLYLAGCAMDDDGKNPGLTGAVEAKEVNINTKIPGRIINIQVREGQQVGAGDILARIDDKDLSAKAGQIQAQLEAARATVHKAETAAMLAAETCSAAVTQAEAALEKAGINADLKEKTWTRVKTLLEQGAVPQQKLDEAEADLAAARAEVKYLEGKVAEARAAQLNMPLREAETEAARAQYEQAAAALNEVNLNLAETVIKAPCPGTITSLNVELGEMVSTGTPLLVITDFGDNWVNVKVPQTRLANLRVNQKATVTPVGSGDQEYPGVVANINKKPEFATIRSTSERGEKDIPSYGVKIRLNAPELHPGMLVGVDFE